MPTAKGTLESEIPPEIYRAMTSPTSTAVCVVRNSATQAETIFVRYKKPTAKMAPRPHKWASTWRGMPTS